MPDRASGLVRDIAVVGASSGGVEALQRLVASLPADHPGTLCVVMHMSPEARSELPAILSRAGPLPAVSAEDQAPLAAGRIYVAPSNCHLLVEGSALRVVHGPKENRHRPAIDPLFRSAAWSHGPRVVGVILSGGLDDGTAGLWAIKSCGGTTVVQAPEDAEHPEMPMNALTHNRIDHRLPLAEIGPLLTRLAREPVGATLAKPPAYSNIGEEVAFAELEAGAEDVYKLGTLSPFTCPSCRGALWEIEEGGHLRYRCHVGHAFSQGSLELEHDIAMETSLYTALRAVEEKAMALRRLADRWPERLPKVKRDYEERAAELDRTADSLRELLGGVVPRLRTAP